MKISQNNSLPEPSQGQRLILDTEQYNLPGENNGQSSQALYIVAGILFLAVTGYFVWRFINTSSKHKK